MVLRHEFVRRSTESLVVNLAMGVGWDNLGSNFAKNSALFRPCERGLQSQSQRCQWLVTMRTGGEFQIGSSQTFDLIQAKVREVLLIDNGLCRFVERMASLGARIDNIGP
eukprot:3162648-Rhodomonas_salina.3